MTGIRAKEITREMCLAVAQVIVSDLPAAYRQIDRILSSSLRSYRAVMKVIGNSERQESGRWFNNGVENAHQPLQRRERTMAKFRSAKSPQKFTSIHSSVHNQFNQERLVYNRERIKLIRSTSLTEWHQFAAQDLPHTVFRKPTRFRPTILYTRKAA